MEENFEEKTSVHSLRSTNSAIKSSCRLSTIPEETKSLVTEPANISSHNSMSLEDFVPIKRSSTSIMLETKMTKAPKRDVRKKSKEKMLSRRVSTRTSTDEKKQWEEYQMKVMKERNLFPTVLKDDSNSSKSKVSKDSLDMSFLVTGFGMRNLESLQNALDRQKRMAELFKSGHITPVEEAESTSILSESIASIDVSTSTADTTLSFDKSFEKQRLEYLMGLSSIAHPEEEYPEEKYKIIVEEEIVEEPLTGTTPAMREAQKYLRTHKIFEFFQFLVSHMLSAIPDSPIDFLMEMLDKCLLYRSGFCEAPLLYTKPHLEQLFYLMDKMRSGFIEIDQYVSGMRTLGICSYNNKPTVNIEGLVAKDTFIEEAYECLVNQMNDMVRRWKGKEFPVTAVPPPTPCSTKCYKYWSGPHPSLRTSQFSITPEG